MPKKLRKSRVKHKARRRSKLLAAKEVTQRPPPLPLSSKQAPAAKSLVTTAEQTERYRYVVADLKRTAVIAGAMFLLLIVLYFLLR